MKKILMLLFAGTMLTGCYTHICPTYSVEPVKKQEIQAQQKKADQQKTMDEQSL